MAVSDCKKTVVDNEELTCQPPANLIAQSPCESNYPGALLIASGHQPATGVQFEYQIFVQKDTLSNDVSPGRTTYGNASNERIIIPESALKDAPKFIVGVLLNCPFIPKQQSGPVYFAFVRRPSTTSCYVWARQKL